MAWISNLLLQRWSLFAGTLNDVYCYDLYCGLADKKMRLGINVQNWHFPWPAPGITNCYNSLRAFYIATIPSLGNLEFYRRFPKDPMYWTVHLILLARSGLPVLDQCIFSQSVKQLAMESHNYRSAIVYIIHTSIQIFRILSRPL